MKEGQICDYGVNEDVCEHPANVEITYRKGEWQTTPFNGRVAPLQVAHACSKHHKYIEETWDSVPYLTRLETTYYPK